MVVPNLLKIALLMTALLLLSTGPMVAASNPEETPSHDGNQVWPPCTIVDIAVEWPYVDVHKECIGTWP